MEVDRILDHQTPETDFGGEGSGGEEPEAKVEAPKKSTEDSSPVCVDDSGNADANRDTDADTNRDADANGGADANDGGDANGADDASGAAMTDVDSPVEADLPTGEKSAAVTKDADDDVVMVDDEVVVAKPKIEEEKKASELETSHTKYLVKWKGIDLEQCTWELASAVSKVHVRRHVCHCDRYGCWNGVCETV